VDELARLRAALMAAGDIVYEWDVASDTIVWHGDLTRLFDCTNDDVPATGERLSTRIHPEDLPQRQKVLSEHISSGLAYDCEYRLRGPDGDFHWVHDRGALDAVRSGAALRLVGTMRLVTSRKANEERLAYLANYDELTGQANKLRLRQALDQALVESGRFGLSGAFLAIGLDQLAMINSAFGYEAGDAVLVAVGERLTTCLRASDVVGRIGGDCFGAVLHRCDQREAMAAAERAANEIRRQVVETPAGPVRVTASAGVVMFPQQANTSYDLMVKGEGALRQAKARGRNCVGLYEMTEEQRRSDRASLDIGAEVQEALKEGRLVFAYQPIVRSADGRVDFYECLLRLRRRDGEIVPAGRFVPVVEQLGLMRALDRHGLDLAVEVLRNDPRASLAINISGLTASDRSWLRALTGKLRDRPDVARRLVVEITETAALRDVEESARFVRAVRDLGCRVALDDFGAGFMTFRHLKALTVDIVKIDGSFVRDIATEPQNRLFVRNLLGLANSLDLSAVAECVETREESDILAAEGADLLQGYFFGKPALDEPWLEAEAEAGGGPVDADQVVDISTGIRRGSGQA
jgi:diguanylate cyclase (GGDEF)-like protein